MAERLSDIATQIQNVRQLEAVVTAMRGIAASRAQKGRSLLAGIEAYTDVVSRAIGEALKLLSADMTFVPPHRQPKLGLILFCAEQGFAGAFSDRVLDSASGDLADAVKFDRRHPRRGRRGRARNKAYLVGADAHPRRRRHWLCKSAGRRLVWLCRRRYD